MQRVPRYPPGHARLVRLEEGPPMYRMLGYADRNNVHADLCDTNTPGLIGPFGVPRLRPNQQMCFGPGRFGLPGQPLAFTTTYYNDRVCDPGCSEKPTQRAPRLPEDRPEAEIFPEMAVPGAGTRSQGRNSGYTWAPGTRPPTNDGDSRLPWEAMSIHPSSLPF